MGVLSDELYSRVRFEKTIYGASETALEVAVIATKTENSIFWSHTVEEKNQLLEVVSVNMTRVMLTYSPSEQYYYI